MSNRLKVNVPSKLPVDIPVKSKKYYSSTKGYMMFKDGFFNMKGIPVGFNYAYGSTIAPSNEPKTKLDINIRACNIRNEYRHAE